MFLSFWPIFSVNDISRSLSANFPVFSTVVSSSSNLSAT
jgi:hypothetical protein